MSCNVNFDKSNKYCIYIILVFHTYQVYSVASDHAALLANSTFLHYFLLVYLIYPKYISISMELN